MFPKPTKVVEHACLCVYNASSKHGSIFTQVQLRSLSEGAVAREVVVTKIEYVRAAESPNNAQ